MTGSASGSYGSRFRSNQASPSPSENMVSCRILLRSSIGEIRFSVHQLCDSTRCECWVSLVKIFVNPAYPLIILLSVQGPTPLRPAELWGSDDVERLDFIGVPASAIEDMFAILIVFTELVAFF